MNDQAIEQEIQAKNLNAPRVTPDRITEVIANKEFYKITGTLTVCVITLRNGFQVTGESACASAANYDREIGEKIAYDNAREKIWVLEGYALKERLWQATLPPQSPE